MGKYRLYPIRDNTIIENSEINTGENGVMELWYGQEGITRYLVKFNTDEYVQQYNLGYVPHITAVTATFHMKNSYPTSEIAYSQPVETVIANGVDVYVKILQHNWAEGYGHDFYGKNKVYGKSNWYSATTIAPWGSFGGDFLTTAFSGYVDNGHEDFSGDITNAIALWDTFTGTDYGLIVKYDDPVEDLTGDTKTMMKFYTRKTATTYFQPYIEFSWGTDHITDQRDELSYELTRRLYLYTRYYDQFATPDDISGVTISYVHPSYSDEFYPSSSITAQYPGVYYIEYTGPVAEVGDSTFTDTWHVRFNQGNGYTDVVQSGDLIAGVQQWNTGQTDVLQSIDYAIHMPNLADHYHTNNIVYLDVQVYEPYTSNRIVLKNMEYKITLLDGISNHVVIGWSNVSYTQDINGFPLNTHWMLPDYDYEIEFRYSVNGAVSKTAKDLFKFRVIEEH